MKLIYGLNIRIISLRFGVILLILTYINTLPVYKKGLNYLIDSLTEVVTLV